MWAGVSGSPAHLNIHIRTIGTKTGVAFAAFAACCAFCNHFSLKPYLQERVTIATITTFQMALTLAAATAAISFNLLRLTLEAI